MRLSAAFFLVLSILICSLLVPAKKLAFPDLDRSTAQIVIDARIVEVTTTPGKLKIFLPDDIRPGDTISGTAAAYPSGRNEQEMSKNAAEMSGYKFNIDFPSADDLEPLLTPGISKQIRNLRFDVPRYSGPGFELKILSVDRTLIDSIGVPINTLGTPAIGNLPVSGALFPSVGQTGRPISIRGSFDGNSDTTRLASNSVPTQILAESPRVAVFESPLVQGPISVLINDGSRNYNGTYRNIGVNLSAPKLALKKGESTTLTVQVTGLGGIREDVPIWLVKTGAVAMEGGDYQHYQIRSGDVRSDATYVTTRKLTGVVAGGFGVTATVVDPTWRPLVIPLDLNVPVNGYSIIDDGNGARLSANGVLDPNSGKPLDGKHRLDAGCKTPVLSKLPVISTLFKNGNAHTEKLNCLIFITPRIIVQDENE